MKTYFTFDNTMSFFGDVGSCHDFPRLARESGFSFNLYRGRIDWSKIGIIDVDRLIRERDLETLQDAVISIMSCSLDNEYDLKVLDPNFVKLFRLAQLSVDYLQYCRRYLDHCVTVIQDQLRVALQEVEMLRKSQQHKEEEIKQLQKKLKGKLKSNSIPRSSPTPIFKCDNCKKVFVTEQYLLAHQMRRHPETFGGSNITQTKEMETLHMQVQQLQERLLSTEEVLKQYQALHAPTDFVASPIIHSDPQKIKMSSDYVSPFEVNGGNPCASQNAEPGESIVRVKTDAQVQTSIDIFPNVIETFEKIKADYQIDRTSLLDCVQQQNNEIKALREQLLVQHQAHESVMQKRLEELRLHHQADLDELRSSLLKPSTGSGDHIAAPPFSTQHNGAYTVPLQQVQQKQRAWEKQENFMDAPSSELADLHSDSKIDVPLKSSKSFQHKDKNADQSQIMQAAVNIPREHDVNSTKIISKSSQNQLYSEGDVSSSESSVQRDANRKINHLDNEDIKSRNKLNYDFKGPSADRSGSKVMDETIQNYNEPSSSPSSESITASGTSSYDSDTHSSPNEMEVPSQEKDLKSIARLELSPRLLEGLKEDLQIILDKRLRELGVDPEWDRLPAASFRSNMATVKHHQNIAAKTHKSYFKIREAILHEVDKRAIEQVKQYNTSSQSAQKKKSTIGSSLLSRLKSSVKNKLSPSGRKSLPNKQERMSRNEEQKRTPVENIYSSEPQSVKLEPGHGHEYETLSTNTIRKTSSVQNDNHSDDEDTSHSSNTFVVNFKDNMTLGTSVLSDENAINLSPPPKQQPLKSLKSFGKSMYANLDRSEIALEKTDSPSKEGSLQQSKNIRTSTPIKDNIASLDIPRKPFQESKALSSFIPSDMESISEMESDANELAERNQRSQVTFPSGPHQMSRSTAELLADVAKLRQSGGQRLTSGSVFKSNLKSSLSTGSIMKKKVIFRDEKDGFNTLELGPVHGSSSSLVPQRSHSDSDLSVSFSAEAVVPVPLPRGSLASSSLQQPVTTGAKNDVEASAPTQDAARTGEERSSLLEESITKTTSRITENTSLNGNRSSAERLDTSHVLNVVKDIERKLELQNRRPLFGVTTATAQYPASPLRASQPRAREAAISQPSVSGLQKNKTVMDDLISDLLLDDLSSS